MSNLHSGKLKILRGIVTEPVVNKWLETNRGRVDIVSWKANAVYDESYGRIVDTVYIWYLGEEQIEEE